MERAFLCLEGAHTPSAPGSYVYVAMAIFDILTSFKMAAFSLFLKELTENFGRFKIIVNLRSIEEN